MEDFSPECKRLADELAIESFGYQDQAENLVTTCLGIVGKPVTKSRFIHTPDSTKQKVKLTVHDAPPSVQIIEEPKGGISAARMRVAGEIASFEERSGFLVPSNPTPIHIVREEDLTHETIVVQVNHQTIIRLALNGLISPAMAAQLFSSLTNKNPDLFVMVTRFLLHGVLNDDGTSKEPFRIVPASDVETWSHLNALTASL